MTPEQTEKAARIGAALRAEPDFVEVTVRGVRYGFLLSGYGAKLARAHGADPVAAAARIASALFSSMKGGRFDLSELDTSPLTGALLDDLAAVLYAGMVPFTPGLDMDDVLAMLTPRTAGELFRQLAPSLKAAFGGDGVEDPAEQKEGAEGK